MKGRPLTSRAMMKMCAQYLGSLLTSGRLKGCADVRKSLTTGSAAMGDCRSLGVLLDKS